MIIYGEDEAIARWVHNLIPHAYTDFGPCVTAGYATESGRLIAGFVFNDYRKHFGTIALSMAAISPMWAKREVIHEILSYPFEQLGVYKLRTLIPADNERAIKVNVHIGFKKEAILAHEFGRKRHAVVMRLLEPDYQRLFGERNEQRRTQHTRSDRGSVTGCRVHAS